MIANFAPGSVMQIAVSEPTVYAWTLDHLNFMILPKSELFTIIDEIEQMGVTRFIILTQHGILIIPKLSIEMTKYAI